MIMQGTYFGENNHYRLTTLYSGRILPGRNKGSLTYFISDTTNLDEWEMPTVIFQSEDFFATMNKVLELSK